MRRIASRNTHKQELVEGSRYVYFEVYSEINDIDQEVGLYEAK